MQITRMNCPVGKYGIKCPDITGKEGISVHNTGNDASAMAEASYMLGNNNKCSFHAVVDNCRAVECLPFDRSCFASGDGRYGKGNARMINVEICYSKSGGQRFAEAERLAAEYIAYLLKKYGWGIDRVTKHQDYSRKYCPHRTLDLGWQRFLNMVKGYLNEKKYVELKQGQAVEIDVNFYHTGAVEGNRFQYDNRTEICWIDGDTRSLIKNDNLKARAIVAWAEAERVLVQVFGNQFWIKNGDVVKILQ